MTSNTTPVHPRPGRPDGFAAALGLLPGGGPGRGGGLPRGPHHVLRAARGRPRPRGEAEVPEGAAQPPGPLPGGGHPQPHPRLHRQDERHHQPGNQSLQWINLQKYDSNENDREYLNHRASSRPWRERRRASSGTTSRVTSLRSWVRSCPRLYIKYNNNCQYFTSWLKYV